MKPSERGTENAEAINSRTGQPKRDQASVPANGERAGGTDQDVPGGAYNVPPGMADEVSDEKSLKQRAPKNPER